jgi:hypothetical protein
MFSVVRDPLVLNEETSATCSNALESFFTIFIRVFITLMLALEQVDLFRP